MNDDMALEILFGEKTRVLRIQPEHIFELEHVCGGGIGSLCKRIFASEFSLADIQHTVRLALIGGGESPARAQELVNAYVTARPLSESYPIAVTILERLWFGKRETLPAEDEPQADDLADDEPIEGEEYGFADMDPTVFQSNDEPDEQA
ncbi:MAG: gene transfer agent family protein [Beijerinckiaceae bacterium]